MKSMIVVLCGIIVGVATADLVDSKRIKEVVSGEKEEVASDEKMEKRFYHITGEGFITRNDGGDSDERVEDELNRYFSHHGVTWPEGSSIFGDGYLGEIIVVNTPENNEKIVGVLSELSDYWCPLLCRA